MCKQGFIYGSLTVGALFFASEQSNAAEKRHPNVIYIYADDMGKGMLSAYGQKQFTTPHIDSLINNGVSFSNAYGCMLSAPARASLLTGYHDCHRNKWRISKGGYFVADDTTYISERESYIDGNDIPLTNNDLYLPQVFKKAGYATGQIGKLGWGFTSTRKQMETYGWDYYYGYLDHVRCHGFYPPFLFENGKIVMIEGNTRKDCGKSIENETDKTYAERHDMTGKKVYSEDLFIDKALQFIDQCKDFPFFLMYSTQLPHGPVSVPAIDPELANNENLTPLEKEYASMMKLLDNNVGKIMAELRRLGLEENTIIVFASDNGHEIYYSQEGRCEKPYRNKKTGELFNDFDDKYYSDKGGDVFNGNAGMAGLKRSNLEGGFHIPLVFYWKGHFESQVSNEVVSNYDFLPTMADMLDVKLPVKKDGISFLSALAKGKKLQKNRYVIMSSNYGPAIVMNDGWKLRYFNTRKTYELYNLQKDPEEKYNVILRFPEKSEELKKILIDECEGNINNGTNNAG